jgi:hypothetical protein
VKERRLVNRALRLFMEEMQAIFRRRAKRSKRFLKANPPCASCAFNPSTLKWRGVYATANSLRQAIAERRPFFCHVGWPWQKPVPKWGDKTLRRFLRERKFCAGWVTVVGAAGLEKAFERAGLQAVKECGR